MNYTIGTILQRKEPFDTPDLEPYNEIRVIGNSPVQTQGRASEWEGQLGENISIAPTSFGGVKDRPFGELERDYEVVSIPEPPSALPPQTIQRIAPGPSPEDTFRAEALASA